MRSVPWYSSPRDKTRPPLSLCHFTLHFTTHIRAHRARAFFVFFLSRRPASFIPSVVRPLARRSRVMSSCMPCDTPARQCAPVRTFGKPSIVKTRCFLSRPMKPLVRRHHNQSTLLANKYLFHSTSFRSYKLPTATRCRNYLFALYMPLFVAGHPESPQNTNGGAVWRTWALRRL